MNCTPDRIEPRIITLRRTDTPYPEIARILGISEAEISLHVALILKRFNLKELNSESIALLSHQVRATTKGQKLRPAATPKQWECLKLYAEEMSYLEIAKAANLRNPQTAQNHVSQACRAIGITHAGRFRLLRVQEYFRNREEQRNTPLQPPSTEGFLNGDPCF